MDKGIRMIPSGCPFKCGNKCYNRDKKSKFCDIKSIRRCKYYKEHLNKFYNTQNTQNKAISDAFLNEATQFHKRKKMSVAERFKLWKKEKQI